MRFQTTLLLAALLFTTSTAGAQRPTVIQGASVIDGSGAPARVANIRIAQGRIVSINNAAPQPGDSIVDARGLTLAPGFIDSHSHHDRGLFDNRNALGAVSQGITTIVVGQDGGSSVPLWQFFTRFELQPAAVNIASYVGHGTLRSRVMGDDYKRPATVDEIIRMRHLLVEEMAAGALGLSTGLEYDPGIYSSRAEVMLLAEAIAPLGGRYISHIRSEDRDFWQALDELLTIGREARIPVQVSHMKLAMRALWGQGDRLIATLDSARKTGIDVTADVYPWPMWQATLTVLYPKRNFDDRAETNFILSQVAAPEDLVLGAWSLDSSYVGKDLGQIAKLRNSDPASTLMALIAEANAKDGRESVIARGMDDNDIDRLYRWPYSSVSSDGELNGRHPRGFGSFPRVLGRYVRERKVLSLEDAVRRMTSLPAASLGIPRGKLEPGAVADLVLFDPATVSERATMAEPRAVSVGIRTVWVAGRVVFHDGKTTGATPGVVIRRAAPRTGR